MLFTSSYYKPKTKRYKVRYEVQRRLNVISNPAMESKSSTDELLSKENDADLLHLNLIPS